MRVLGSLLAASLVAALGGCISVDVGGKKDAAAPADLFHVLDPSVAAEAASRAPRPATAARGVVAVRAFRAAGRFDKHVLRRDGPGLVSALDHDYWADEPSAAVTDAVREALAAVSGAAAVVDPSGAHEAAAALDGAIQEFTFVEGTPSKALVRVRFTWSDGRTGRVQSSRVEEAFETVPGPGTVGLGEAMARAVGRVAAAAAATAPVRGARDE